jgi:hypothetical protein
MCPAMRRRLLAVFLFGLAGALSGCGGTTLLHRHPVSTVTVAVPTQATSAPGLNFPALATKNTTRVAGSTPAADAAGVALAVYPSAAPGTHPTTVVLAPTVTWQAAIAASVLMAAPLRAPILLSGAAQLPAVTGQALTQLAPTGAGAAGGAQLIRIGSVPRVSGRRTAAVSGADPYTLAAGIDRFATAAQGSTSKDVVIASAISPAYAMPAAGWAAESGDPVLFVGASGIPAPTRQALLAHQHPRIYVLGPPSVISEGTLTALRKYGTVKRVGAGDPAANSVSFAKYRDPACVYAQACVHVPGSFGWAIRSPGHAFVLLNAGRPLDAAASAPLSASGGYGPQLVLDNASTLPKPVLNFFLDYATPGYTQEGPTAAVYNHGWVIGDPSAVSVSVQAEMDRLLEAVPQNSK